MKQQLSFLPLLAVSLVLLFSADVALADAGVGIHVDVDKIVAAGEVVPVDGITSAGQPDEAAFRVFADSGYVAVIDMRGPDEDRGLDDEPGLIEALGMDYVAFPIESKEAINVVTANKLDILLATFDGPVLVHCASGNRVGALLALRYSAKGRSDEEVLVYGRNAGMTRLEDVVRQRLSEN